MPQDAQVFLDGSLRTVSGVVARVSGKVDVPGRTKAAPMGRTITYCRVSSRDQNPQLQLDALHAHGYDQLFAEKESRKHGVHMLATIAVGHPTRTSRQRA
jgi:predicted site-specific integrase-resolvase